MRNLIVETNEDAVKQSWGRFNPCCVERIKEIRPCAFVRFASPRMPCRP